MMKSYLFRKVTIVGVGLMGGSLGLAIKKFDLAQEVVGLSRRQASLDEAIQKKAIDLGFIDIAEAVRNADLVILATPVSSIIKLFPTINPHLKRGGIVTDMGSAKLEIVEAAEKTLSNPGFFVGSHPLAGSDKKGIEHARAEIFDNALCVMTPTTKTNQVAHGKIKYLWTKIGCVVKDWPAKEHDETLAYISHLPHLLAYSLMETIPAPLLENATPSLKDTTRIAGSCPKMWSDIYLANSRNILKSLDDCVKILSYLRKAIVDHDEKALIYHLTIAKEKRDAIK